MAAREVGYARLTPWTNDTLGPARKICQAAGIRPVRQERHRSFGTDPVGQCRELDLSGPASPRAPSGTEGG